MDNIKALWENKYAWFVAGGILVYVVMTYGV